jgi:hypothetical protein
MSDFFDKTLKTVVLGFVLLMILSAYAEQLAL